MVSVVIISEPAFPKQISGEDRILGVVPFYHIYGQFTQFFDGFKPDQSL
jgi:hypothetical protein